MPWLPPAFKHLRGHHKPVDLARAVLLGVTDNVIEILRQLEEATCPSEIIYASGGFHPIGGLGGACWPSGRAGGWRWRIRHRQVPLEQR